MKTVFGILRRDLVALLKNPIALLVVGALLVLPGLYAWYCIVANLDPYSNTGNMPIAVVNHDRGATSDLTGEVNVGEQVIESLEHNDSIDWRFYDNEEDALKDTREAICYATIVLPENLSENLIGIFSGSEEQPTIYYYPNEKYNAVATKVSDSAAQTLIRQINQNFSSTVNKTLLKSVQDANNKIDQRADNTKSSAEADIRAVQDDLEKVIATLDDATSSIAGWKTAASGASSTLSATAEQLPAIRTALDKSSGSLDSLRKNTGTLESDLARSILDSAGTVSGLSAQTASTLSNAKQDLEAIGEQLESLIDSTTDDDLKGALKSLEAINSLIKRVVGDVDARISKMNDDVQGITKDVTSATNTLSDEVVPQLSAGSYELATSLAKLSGAIGQFEPQITQLRSVLSQTDSALDDASDAIADAKSLLTATSDHLGGTISDLGMIRNALQVDAIADLLKVDSDNVGSFISSPVEMITQTIFPISNYGTAVTPFYTNLALWIGCFILVSLIHVEVNSTGFPGTTTTQRYLGRWLLFVILSLLQSQVICGVDLLLDIDCANPAAFMAAGAVCSFVYMNLIFALVITFRNIGKTLCILLLIMQVPGSSGMYPIEMMPEFFQFIHGALPFTYGIDAMRESLCGMYGTSYISDLLVLLAIVPASLLLGLAIRPRLLNLTQLFDQEMTATGFFASEIHGKGSGNTRLLKMMQNLATSDSYRDEVEERAWRFTRRYPKLRRAGSVIMFAIPFVFLALIALIDFFFEPSIDAKIFWLVFMLFIVLLVQVALIVLEYVHRTVTEQTRLLGLQVISEAGGDSDDFLDLATLLLDDSDVSASPTAQPLDDSEKTGPVRDIFLTDLRLGFHSVVGIVVIMLLVITPSLYAWFNTAGSWNPYGNTGNLKVAVANEDEGYKGDITPVRVNVGDTIVAQLRGNNSFNWEFVGKDEAVEGVTSGDYYAAIEIPSNFSRDLMTYLANGKEYPEVTYYTNKKENPIAPIITEKGASSIQESIRVSFTERVDEIVLTLASDMLDYAVNPRVSNYVMKMSEHLDDATHDMKSGARELGTLSGLTGTVSSIIETTGTTLDGVKEAGNSAKTALTDAKAGVKNATAAFDKATALVDDMTGKREADVSGIKRVITVVVNMLEDGTDKIPGLIDVAIDQVRTLKKANPSTSAARFNAVLSALKAAKRNAEKIPGTIDESHKKLEQLTTSTSSEISRAKTYLDAEIKPSIGALKGSLSEAAGSTQSVVDGIENSIAGVAESTDGLSSQVSLLSEGLAKASDRIEDAASSIEGAKQRLSEALASDDTAKIKALLLGSDTEDMAKRLATPVQQHREAMYSVANYGSSMAPFYTVLSLWVGALVMISTMRVHIVEQRIEELRKRYANLRPRHEFFGRYGIFGLVGLMQSTLVLLGDLCLLHIQCVNPVLFFLFGLFIGQVFCLVVYTLTELFGDVGKALCVILLIMQVAASGGTFPVQMLDPLLTNLVPFLPFYHAMSLLQECVAGINWIHALRYIAALFAIAGIALIVALPLRRPFRKLTDFFEEQLEKTGYM